MYESFQLRRNVESIWRAGLDAVDSGRLLEKSVVRSDDALTICGQRIALADLRQILVVGAGKAGAGMAAAFERVVGPDILKDKLSGWVNVPADCVVELEKIHLHAARPAGINEPTQAGIDGAAKILECVSQLTADDLCVVLLSGGGSALLPAPVAGISLEEKQQVTRLLMNAGATIHQLNCVRKQLSRIKGGGLARAAGNARCVMTLIISDVVGDPLDTIASGPTVDDSSTPDEALTILNRYAHSLDHLPTSVVVHLMQSSRKNATRPSLPENVSNHIIGNNQMALAAAAECAQKLGYPVLSLGSDNEGEARSVGRELAKRCLAARDQGTSPSPPLCILSGGEPVVHLIETEKPRRGGRNQELVLAALEHLWDDGMQRVAILSGGTDGEDGPTDAAGAFADAQILSTAKSRGLIPGDFLEINNSYPFFEQTGGLLKTGPTHTNVMDVRVALVAAKGERPV